MNENGIKTLAFTTVNMIDSVELSDLTLEVYGKEYDFASFQDCANGSVHSLDTVTPHFWGTEKQKQKALKELQAWINGDNDQPIDSRIILWDLCVKGHVLPGDYNLNVWW